MGVTFSLNMPSHRPDLTVDLVRATALEAERLGFESIYMADHVVLPNRVDSVYPYSPDGASVFRSSVPFFEPISTMLYLAGCTTTLRLGLNVLIVPYRPAVLTAKMLAMLDVLSGGRLTVGVGVGWMAEEFEALGLDTYADRGAVTDEYLQVFKALWTEDTPRFDGRFCQVADVTMLPRPVQAPHPPIWVGGHTGPALRRAARHGDAWLPLGTFPPALFPPDALRPKIERLRQLTVEAGRPEDAVELCFGGVVAFLDDPGSERMPLQGRPEQIIEDVHAYRALGVRHFVLYFVPPARGSREALTETMARFAAEVVPACG
jgi:probable F420-dependent oxidoreductase